MLSSLALDTDFTKMTTWRREVVEFWDLGEVDLVEVQGVEDVAQPSVLFILCEHDEVLYQPNQRQLRLVIHVHFHRL